MKVKIQHRSSLHLGVMAASMFIIVLLLIINYHVEATDIIRLLVAPFFVIFVLALGYGFIDGAFYSTVTIEQGRLNIKYPFGERDIPADSIKSLNFRHYTISHRNSESNITTHEYRVKLEIGIYADGKTKQLVLNDSAEAVPQGLFSVGSGQRLPDGDIPLYNVYRCLCDITGITGMDDII